MERLETFIDLQAGETYWLHARADLDGLVVEGPSPGVAGFIGRTGDPLQTSRGRWSAMLRRTRLGFGVKSSLLQDGELIGGEHRRPGPHRYSLELNDGTKAAVHTRYGGRWEISHTTELLAHVTVGRVFVRHRRPIRPEDEAQTIGSVALEPVSLPDDRRDALLMLGFITIKADMISQGGRPPSFPVPTM